MKRDELLSKTLYFIQVFLAEQENALTQQQKLGVVTKDRGFERNERRRWREKYNNTS